MIKYCSHKDIDLAIQILKTAIKNTEGTHAETVLKAPLNRVIFQLEEIVKQDLKELIK